MWLDTVVVSVAASGHDRAAVRVQRDAAIIALADGAGGTPHAGEAADAVIATAMSRGDCCELIERVDAMLSERGGQTTAIIIDVMPTSLVGASVGDSQAWIIGDSITELTSHQRRKPLVGDGCMPISFSYPALGTATLLVASDGLFAYAKRADIVRVAQQPDLDRAAQELVELVRLPSGGVPDDVTVVLARVK